MRCHLFLWLRGYRTFLSTSHASLHILQIFGSLKVLPRKYAWDRKAVSLGHVLLFKKDDWKAQPRYALWVSVLELVNWMMKWDHNPRQSLRSQTLFSWPMSYSIAYWCWQFFIHCVVEGRPDDEVKPHQCAFCQPIFPFLNKIKLRNTNT